jgi:hypothetical protein
MSGLKINFSNSKVYCIDGYKDQRLEYEEIFTYKSGDLPLKYFCVPIDK